MNQKNQKHLAAVAKSKDAIKFINDEQLKQTLMALYNID